MATGEKIKAIVIDLFPGGLHDLRPEERALVREVTWWTMIPARMLAGADDSLKGWMLGGIDQTILVLRADTPPDVLKKIKAFVDGYLKRLSPVSPPAGEPELREVVTMAAAS